MKNHSFLGPEILRLFEKSWVETLVLTNVTLLEKDTHPRVERYSFYVLLMCNLLLVISAKALVFKWFYKRRPLKPLDYLVLVDEVEKFAGFLCLSVIYLMYEGEHSWHFQPMALIQSDIPFDSLGWSIEIACLTKITVVGFIAQMFVGGLGISIMRLLYIRCGNWLYRHGENNIAAFILVTTQLWTFLTVFVYRKNVHNGSLLICEKVSSQFAINFHPTNVTVPLLTAISVVEFTIYLSICHFINKQNKSVQKYISNFNFKKRRRENAISFTGHFLHFLMEMLLILLFNSRYKFIFGFGPISVVTVLFSSSLRKEFVSTCHDMLNLFVELQTKVKVKYFFCSILRPMHQHIFNEIPVIVIEEASDVGSSNAKDFRCQSVLSMVSTQTVTIDMPTSTTENPESVRTYNHGKQRNFLTPTNAKRRKSAPHIRENKDKMDGKGMEQNGTHFTMLKKKTVAEVHVPGMPDVDC